ncbi:cysteine--tRNA ligase [Desmospora profundinema]|uniref:Cysteine--tRNA ligase n=1 Tax=Desmospora profundinema TaxID=1571184 RepID=A0ABU1IRD3_9BACL|nr:cysteine--tRNA ligase [Desmospora profundinema]MDR6226983.1 cysteinyl-tRNA synthetase [Desmospora profundinema]
MSLRVYNTLTRELETFQPLEDGKVRMYVCGPTVYNYIHIGNARVFVFFDVVRRYLQYKGFDVSYIQNFTDVDDKLIKRAQEENTTVPEMAERYIQAYFEDMDALGVKRADIHPQATEHIAEMQEGILRLIETGYAYEVDGDVYYRTRQKDDYGKLSHQSLEELKSGARVEVNDKKESSIDFALWKRAKPGEIAWDSPWGKGRPGWHIECSAMSRKYLGDTLDIHAGGMDLCFPHHENEIAQSEAWTEKPLARYWLHNGYVNMGNEKMSKSLGNIATVRDLRQNYEPRALRYFLLSAHYRNPIAFSHESIRQIESGLERLDTAVVNLRHRLKSVLDGEADPEVKKGLTALGQQLEAQMDEDLNAANAISVLHDWAGLANDILSRPTVSRGTLQALLEWVKEYGSDLLGLVNTAQDEDLDTAVEALIEERQQARAKRDFQRADTIRDQLQEMGIILEDTPQGVRWRRK